VIGARGDDDQGFGDRIHRVREHRLAQLFGELRTARLARHDGVPPARRGRGVGDELDVRGLARAVDAFQRDESAALAHLPRRSW
jgi:hypothetical protein